MEFAPDKARWRQVADVIRDRIEDGTYPPRTRVPSVIQLTAEFGIANATAHKVLGGLRAEGLTYTEPGLGSFVSPADAPPPGRAPDIRDVQPIWRRVATVMAARIAEGDYPVGAPVPSVAKLSSEFSISESTAHKVLAHLRDKGLVRAEVGLGSFVAERPESLSSSPEPGR
ncbi:winged helix-turn-helix domain-containing protein [Streptomyces sp. NPDC050439]|uniref:winged helix-turn-helix domain-containing protein n=1 Tax=unclassified Streptomyces TaxID=2593676 RepID=UPI00343FD1E1